MVNLNYQEALLINGGSEETYNNGYELGVKIKTFIVDVRDWIKGFSYGFNNR